MTLDQIQKQFKTKTVSQQLEEMEMQEILQEEKLDSMNLM